MKRLILFSFVMVCLSCNKYDDTGDFKHLQVPPYTETGANTFGCLVNGSVWANFGDYRAKTELTLGNGNLVANKVKTYVYRDPTGLDSVFSVGAALSVSKHGTNIREEGMGFTIPKNGNLKGIHQLNNNNYQFDYSNGITYIDYVSFIGKTFTVIIKKDTIEGNKHIVSGTFSGMLYTRNKTDSLRITGGVFDAILN